MLINIIFSVSLGSVVKLFMGDFASLGANLQKS